MRPKHSESFVPGPARRCASRVFVRLVILATIGNAGATAQPLAAAQRRPNVVLILADDLGWSDTTLFGTTSFYHTPNIERLASRGMTFTRAYSASPLCSPTRASVLTGLGPARHGITSPNCHLPTVTLTAKPTKFGPPDRQVTGLDSVSRLDTAWYTLAEMFRDNGYATGHFGKWHLGADPYSPLQHGFDVDVPHHPGPGPAGSYVAPWKFKDFDHDPDIPNQHIEDRMAEEAVAFLEQHKDKPFFLNYWMFSVHAPFDAKQSLIKKYTPLADPENPQRSPTYAAMIESMDDAVGTLLDTLDRLKVADNTIIIFASDNGGNMYNEVDGTTPTSNTPLRGGKATMYEGGIRGPAVVVCPDTVEPGSRSHEIIQSTDFYPTLLELLDIQPRPQQSFDGISIVPALSGRALNRSAIFTYFPHSPPVPDWLPAAVSVHAGEWKLIRIFHGGEENRHRYKLYNLSTDIGEQKDLAAHMPDRVRQLDRLIDGFLADTNAVVPLPNPRFDPARYQPELEGRGRQRHSSNSSKKTTRRPRPAVAGWQPGGTCHLSVAGMSLVVTSDGGDPYITCSLPSNISETHLTLAMSMSSRSQGTGRVYWEEQGIAPKFSRDRSQSFNVSHDGKTHRYRLTFSAGRNVRAIRIDPSTGTGTMRISELQLIDAAGRIVHQWNFANNAAPARQQ